MNKNEKYFVFLDDLRESGITNMLGARPYLMEAFPELANKYDAQFIVSEWMEIFSKRHDC